MTTLLHNPRAVLESLFDLIAGVWGMSDNQKHLLIQGLSHVITCLTFIILTALITMVANNI